MCLHESLKVKSFMSNCYGLLLHGDAPFGWQGFVFAAILCIVLVVLVNELAAGAMKSHHVKKRRPKHTIRY